jgi:hypothetical protein
MQAGFIIIGIVFSLVGIVLVTIAIFTKQKPKPIFDKVLPAEGTIIDLGILQPRPFKKIRYSEPVYTQVTVEFLTNSNQIVKGEIDTNLTLFYSGQYKKGDKVNLVYNAEKPTQFIIISLQSTNTARLIMIISGLFLLMTGIGMVLFINSFNFLTK